MSNATDKPYLHGFSTQEALRLRHQAEFAEQQVYKNIDLSNVEHLLEVGCGVGAQTAILLRRFPRLKITGIDRNDSQIASAIDYLNSLQHFQGRFELHSGDANNLEVEPGKHDGAFLCWVLEHVDNPAQILSEVRRVLRPGSLLYVTEVMNHTFFLDPYSPSVWKYWQAFNDFQYDCAGDPFIGAKLGNLLLQSGYTNVKTNIRSWHWDNRYPRRRKEFIEFWSDLMLSAADQLLEAKVVTEELIENTKRELKKVANDPNAVFMYSLMQASARTS
jgi:ubiquinone/menaquinone biosynthesis C-methylase UbiE